MRTNAVVLTEFFKVIRVITSLYWLEGENHEFVAKTKMIPVICVICSVWGRIDRKFWTGCLP